MNVPKIYWGHVVLTTCYHINRLLTRVLGKKSPLDVLSKFLSPFPLSPQVFGCTYFVRDDNSSCEKLDPRALKCVFVGYSPTQKGYKSVF